MIKGYREFQNRSVRIFISSTFQDMDAERNLLVEDVFPRLSSRFAPRGISISEVDLRWGIPESLATDRRTLRICIEEIENCQPFFMGILGQREGYRPDEDEIALLDEHMRTLIDLDGSHGISITEMEMNAGIHTSTPAAASFHVRGEDARYSARLETFEQRVTELGYTCQRYDSLADFTDQVVDAITGMVETRFGTSPIEIDNEPYRRQLAHLVSARKGIVPSEQVQDLLRQALDGTNVHICAGQGMGKTATIAYLATALGVDHDQDVFFHFALDGTASTTSELWQGLITFLGGTHIDSEADVDEVGLFLRAHPRSRPTYLLVDDAAGYAGHKDVRGRLQALCEIDRNLVVICTSDEEPISWHGVSVVLEPLGPEQICNIASDYFQTFGKIIEQEQAVQLSSNPALSNPLLLRFVLNEQRTALSFQGLREGFKRLARVRSLEEAVSLACQRVATQLCDLGLHEILTWQTMAVLVCTKHGLFEEELIESTGALPLEWSMIRSTLASVLHDFDGKWSVTSEVARKALRVVAESHLGEVLATARQSLINLFLTQAVSPRTSDELAHLYAEGLETEALIGLLGDYPRVKALAIERREALIDYLTLAQDHADELIHPLYRGICADKASEEAVEALLHSLNAAGCYRTTIGLAELMRQDAAGLEPKPLQVVQVEKHEARAHYKMGAAHYQKSIELYSNAIAQLEGCNDVPSFSLLAELTFKRAIVQKSSGRPHDARKSYEKAVAAFRSLGSEDGNFSWALGNLASLLYLFGEDERCRQLFEEALALRAKAYGERSPEVAWTYCYFFSTLFSAGDVRSADRISRDAMRFYAESFGENSTQFAWSEVNRGNLCAATGKLEEARTLLRDSIEKNDRFMGGGAAAKPGGLSTYSLTAAGNLAVIDWLSGSRDEARRRLAEVAAYTAQVHDERHPYTCNARLNCILTGNRTEAEKLLPSVIAVLAEELGEDVPDTRFARQMLEAAQGKARGDVPGTVGDIYLARNNGAQLVIVPAWAKDQECSLSV